MTTGTPWHNVIIPAGEHLPGRVVTEVCVIGAGITGLSVAHQLLREGRRVVVVDRGRIGEGETSRTTAHLASALDDRFMRLERLHGADGAHMAAQSHRAAIDCIESFVAREGVDCDFRRLDGYLVLGDGQSADLLEHELAAARRAGLDDVEHVGDIVLGVGPRRPALRFPRQGELHPMRYMAALASAIQREGGIIYTNARVESIENHPLEVVVHGERRILADAVVIATNTPVTNRVTLHTKQAPYRTYVVGLSVPRGLVPPALFWDTEDPYHYLRTARGEGTEDILIVGGRDHKTGQADDGLQRWAALEEWARARFPEAGAARHRWSGQVLEPVDGLAYIGKNPGSDEAIFVATGDSGHGMTHGTIAGLLLGAMLGGRSSPWEKLYDPSRLHMRALGTFAKENINAVGQYTDWLGPADVKDENEIALGSGAVVRRGLHRLAVYRDLDGTLHERSAVCPHLGGVVCWNSVEKSWDCPVHGSRFDPKGHVLCGPANADLAPAADDEPVKTGAIIDTGEQLPVG
jgi:glycine/D-amino acid oxidase-like deaminating enzyme/nitrite reductase/ring-hydroxylating ferredoxin subunit